MLHILITGGLGYVGSHCCVKLLEKGYEVTILDNFENSYKDVLFKIEAITGKKPHFIEGDIRNYDLLERIFSQQKYDAVMHFAALKSVADSGESPLRYYDYNVNGTLTLLKILDNFGPRKFIFSSTATVYGIPHYLPYDEHHPLAPINVYGQTKLTVENMLRALATKNSRWQVNILRYFNPVGAHESGLIGEFPRTKPTNLMPFVAQVAKGLEEKLYIHGLDYETDDGSAIRDYIHVMDLADAHVMALEHLEQGAHIYNLGRDVGLSVLEIVKAFQQITGQKIPYEVGPRRQGDLPSYYASSQKAYQAWGWKAKKDVLEMCADFWRFQENYQKPK